MAEQENSSYQLTDHDDLCVTPLIQVAENSKYDSSDDETSSSGVSSDDTILKSTSDQQMISDPEAELLFKQTMASLENNFFMKVYKSSQFTEVAKKFYNEDEDIQNQWIRTVSYYRNNLKCIDDNHIQSEFGKCIDAIMNDGRKIMIGLDSIEVVKDVLISCMRICSQPNFKLEIRVGLGGTIKPLTVRTPAYAIAGIDLLYRLLELSKYFLSDKKSFPGIVKTTRLHNAPLLIFYSAYTAAVEVNNLDENTAKNTAVDILSYIEVYINKYHPHLMEYVRYEMDHSNTYQPELLDRISKLFKLHCHDDTLLKALDKQGKAHGSDMEGSIKYASTHSIGFRDVIDKNNSYSLFNPLNRNGTNVQFNQEIYLPDCIISIGGSVERRFGKTREIIRQAFRESLLMNNEDRFHLPLSIRMLSQAGEIPVYYHHPTHEIIVNGLLNSNAIDLYQNKEIPRSVKEDLLIVTDDIGISILKPIWEHIPTIGSSEISSWGKTVSTLIELCLKTWKEHVKDQNRTCKCSKETTETVTQFFKHYDILNYLDDTRRSIISCIIVGLQDQNQTPFGTNNPHSRSDSKFETKKTINDLRPHRETINTINKKLDDILGRIFVNFIREKFNNNNN